MRAIRGVREDALANLVRAEAQAVGFAHVAIAKADPLKEHAAYVSWVSQGFAGEMEYLYKDVEVRKDPRFLLAEAQTVVCVALSYLHGKPIEPQGSLIPLGRIARYAQGEDYHLVLKHRLHKLAERLMSLLGGTIAYRTCVDTAPLLERAIASSCGLGFPAKNTLLITPGVGSFTVLGELLLSVAIAPTVPISPRCGECRLCLSACPTGALLELPPSSHVLDSRRCISYLTIEYQGEIPRDLRPLLGNWIFGCDLCQEVCPWNAAGRQGDPALRPKPHLQAPELASLLLIGAAQFRGFVKRTALRRIHRRQLQRNVAIALGNVGTPTELSALRTALGTMAPMVRKHIVWALWAIAGRYPSCSDDVQEILQTQLKLDTDEGVREEILLHLPNGIRGAF